MSPDRAQDRMLQLSRGLFGAPSGSNKAGAVERRYPDSKAGTNEGRPSSG